MQPMAVSVSPGITSTGSVGPGSAEVLPLDPPVNVVEHYSATIAVQSISEYDGKGSGTIEAS